MSEIKPVYQVQQLGEWIEVDKSIFDELYIQNKFQHRILYPAADYEALQKENIKIEDELDQYKEYYEEMSEHYKGLQFIESELRKDSEAQAKRIAELEETLNYYKNMVGA